jgi:hypothetical protein
VRIVVLKYFLIFPFIAQALLMLVDEFHFHRARGLDAWERWGHPLDSMTVLVCFLWLVLAPLTQPALIVYLGLAMVSCFFVTKDEFVHARACKSGEQWLHAILFILHPMIFVAAGAIRWIPEFVPFYPVLQGQIFAITGFMLYQLIYWNAIHDRLPANFRQ